MSTTREHIIQTTCDLLENQGYHATGMNEIVKESGAPKGSIYYYFPAGKDEISAEAVLYAGRVVAERIHMHLTGEGDPAEVIQTFIETIAHHVESSGFRAGGPLTIVASETATTNERLNLACREAYTMLRDAFQARLVEGGFGEEAAAGLAVTITAAVEGGIILSRTFHSGDALRTVAKQIGGLIRASRSVD